MIASPQLGFDPTYLAQLELLRIESRRKFLGSRQGGHLSLKKGHGIEFSDYRQYELGDNPRYIDWKAYGRTDRLYVKRFQEEQDFLISVFLDCSSSMGIETDPEKWRFSCKVALSFAYIGMMQQDKVTLNLLSQGKMLRSLGPSSFLQFSDALRKVASPQSHVEFGRALRNAAINVKFPGVAIVISDFHCPIEEIDLGLRYLRSKNLDIVAIQTLGSLDLAPLSQDEFSSLLDSETGENFDLEFDTERRSALESLIQEHQDRLREYFRQRQIGFMSIRSGQDIVAALRSSGASLKIIE